MTKPKFTQADMDAVSDNPEWTEEDFARAKPFAEVFPQLAKTIVRKRGRPVGTTKDNAKQQIALRVDADILAAYKAGGPGWQTRMNEALRKGIKGKAAH